MAIILASSLDTYTKDELGNRIAHPLEDENKILTNIKRFVKNTNRVVYIANDPKSIEENDIRVIPFFESLDQTGLKFKEKILLDKRNYKNYKEILSGANLLILSGGKCLCQNKFLRKIKLKKFLKNYNGLAIGISAGAMNLCKTVANFPEELIDLKEPRWLKGLNLFDGIIIPHFDGENVKYQYECEEVDLIHDYVLPMANKKAFIGIPNGSYILIDNEWQTEYYGDMYKISKGKVEKFLK